MECPHLAVSVKIQNNLRKESTDVTKEWHCAGKCRPSGKVFFVYLQSSILNLHCICVLFNVFYFRYRLDVLIQVN